MRNFTLTLGALCSLVLGGIAQSNSWQYLPYEENDHSQSFEFYDGNHIYVKTTTMDDIWFFRQMDLKNTGEGDLELAVELIYEAWEYEDEDPDTTWSWSYCVTGHCNDHMKPYDKHDVIAAGETGWHDLNLEHRWIPGKGTFALRHYDLKTPKEERVYDTLYMTICYDHLSAGGDHSFCDTTKLENPAVGILEHNPLTHVQVFPNPVEDQLTISWESVGVEFDELDCVIVDVTGKIILKERLTAATTTLDVNSLGTGVYFVRFNTGKYLYTQKIMVE